MTLAEAVSDMERLYSSWAASPPEIKRLVLFALAELDRQRAAARTPTLAAMMEAVPDNLMASIVADQRRGVAAPSSLASNPNAPQPEPRPKGSGWQDAAPLAPPPGIDILDRMMDQQDRRDKAALIDAEIRKQLRK
jgi:hypothetical protein